MCIKYVLVRLRSLYLVSLNFLDLFLLLLFPLAFSQFHFLIVLVYLLINSVEERLAAALLTRELGYFWLRKLLLHKIILLLFPRFLVVLAHLHRLFAQRFGRIQLVPSVAHFLKQFFLTVLRVFLVNGERRPKSALVQLCRYPKLLETFQAFVR